MSKPVKNMGFDVVKVMEKRDRKSKYPSLRKDNWTDQAKKDFEYYENCTRKQFERLGE